MPIDDCTHSFKHLAEVVLPTHMARMRAAMKVPVPMSKFLGVKKGPATIAKEIGVPRDFSGCYVLMDRGNGIYAGISRKVLSRLRPARGRQVAQRCKPRILRRETGSAAQDVSGEGNAG
jgi:hypothetical protein